MPEIQQLSEEARRLIAEARTMDRPPAGTREANWAGLQSKMAAATSTNGGGNVLGLCVMGAVAAAIVGIGLARDPAPVLLASTQGAGTRDAVAASGPLDAVGRTLTLVPPPVPNPWSEVGGRLAVRQMAAANTNPSGGAPAAAPPAHDLAAELRLLDRATEAVQTRDYTRAVATLAAHRRTFPQGILESEREALWALALCGSGDSRGPEAGRRFVRRFKDSPLRSKVERACADQD